MLIPIWQTPQGIIGTVSEGLSFNFPLIFINPSVTPISATIIAGELPLGLTMDSLGNISGTIGTVPVPSEFEFTVRLTNGVGSVDRSFQIQILDLAPSWPDPSDLGSVLYNSLFEYSLFVIDPGHQHQTFEKISGTLPPGITLSPNGILSGLALPVLSDTTFTFGIRALLDGIKFVDKIFILTVIVTGNRNPLWATPAGLLGDIQTGVPFSIQLYAGDPTVGYGSSITYSALGLPPGFTLSPTGLLSGTLSVSGIVIYSFSVIASDGSLTTSRIFSLQANQIIATPIIWVTPAGSLGSIREGDKSLFGVKAQSISRWLRYDLVSGALPPGMSLDVNTGNIWGIANEQGLTTTYSFVINAYNDTESELRTFSIQVLDAYLPSATRIYASIYGVPNHLDYIALFGGNDIPSTILFREGDSQYGTVEKPKILLIENANAPTVDQVFTTLNGIKNTKLVFGEVKVAHAVQNNVIVYDVLYRHVYDASAGSLFPFANLHPVQIIKTGALDHLRSQLLASFGPSGGTDRLPLWMTSEQIIGDPTTALGWFPALPFAYVQPGTGETIAAKMNTHDQFNNMLYGTIVEIDRVILEPTADSTFAPVFVLFDNQPEN